MLDEEIIEPMALYYNLNKYSKLLESGWTECSEVLISFSSAVKQIFDCSHIGYGAIITNHWFVCLWPDVQSAIMEQLLKSLQFHENNREGSISKQTSVYDRGIIVSGITKFELYFKSPLGE